MAYLGPRQYQGCCCEAPSEEECKTECVSGIAPWASCFEGIYQSSADQRESGHSSYKRSGGRSIANVVSRIL